MLFLQGLAAKLIEGLLAKLGAYLSKEVKILLAKVVLNLKVRKEIRADQEKMKAIRDKIEKANTDTDIDSALDDLRNHF